MFKYTPISALSAVALLALTACGSANTGASSTAPATSSASASASATATAAASVDASTGLAISNNWIKAAPGNMTGAFATITNTSDKAITITGASSSASDRVELHTTELDSSTGTSTMKKKEDGFTIEPGQTLELAPGGDHIMLMDMTCSLVAGTTAVITLETSAGKVSLDSEVRDYSGAKEEYAPGESSPAASAEHSHDHGDGHDHSHDHSHAAESTEVALPQCA